MTKDAASPTPNSLRDWLGPAVVVISLLLAGAAIWARRQLEFAPETLARDAAEARKAAAPTPTPER